MLLKQINTDNPSFEWIVFREKTFSVSVKGWGEEDNWKWNVYATIFDNHPLYNNPEAAHSLHFHCGVTYDKYITTDETVYKYDWQKQSRVLKVGSDYYHDMDNMENENPREGIPFNVQWDAQKLAEDLHEIAENNA